MIQPQNAAHQTNVLQFSWRRGCGAKGPEGADAGATTSFRAVLLVNECVLEFELLLSNGTAPEPRLSDRLVCRTEALRAADTGRSNVVRTITSSIIEGAGRLPPVRGKGRSPSSVRCLQRTFFQPAMRTSGDV